MQKIIDPSFQAKEHRFSFNYTSYKHKVKRFRLQAPLPVEAVPDIIRHISKEQLPLGMSIDSSYQFLA